MLITYRAKIILIELTMDLIISGREILGREEVLRRLWEVIGEPLFIRHIINGDYDNEPQLLNNLRDWVNGPNRPFLPIPQKDATVNVGVFPTHQRYIRAGPEFGDITFATSFSSPNSKRITYVNTFQIKLGDTPYGAYRELFGGHNLNQLEYYRRDLTLNIGGPYPEICDFLYYWLIKQQPPRSLIEVPLSSTWVGRAPLIRWPGYLPRYRDIMYRCLFLITGVNMDSILGLCTDGLRRVLEDITKHGVCPPSQTKTNNSMNDYPEKPPTEFKPPEFPISSAFVMATEVKLLK
jgi:hypothetical protein